MDENLILYFFWLLLEIELLSQMVPFNMAGHIYVCDGGGHTKQNWLEVLP